MKMETIIKNNEIEAIETDIKESVLTTVIDPEIEIDIVNLGLVYEVEFDGIRNVFITMTLSTPTCPLGDSIVMNVIETVKRKYPEMEVDVNLVYEPQWNDSMITPKGRIILGM
jgi:metal-sulfur cluster biosynthetic enzyme